MTLPGGCRWARRLGAVGLVAMTLGWTATAAADDVDTETDTNGDGLADVHDVDGDGILDDDKTVVWRAAHVFDDDVPGEFLPPADDTDGDGLADYFDGDGDGIVDADRTGIWRAAHDWDPVPAERLPSAPSGCTTWLPRTGGCLEDGDGDGLGDVYDLDGDGYVDLAPVWDQFVYDHPDLDEVPEEIQAPKPADCRDAWSPRIGCWEEYQPGVIDGVVDTISGAVDAALSAAGSAVAQGFETALRLATTGMLEATGWVADRMLGLVNDSTGIEFLSPVFLGDDGAYARMGVLALQLLVIFGVVAVGHVVLTGGGPERIAGVAKDVALTVPLLFVFPPLVSAVAGIADSAFLWLAGDPSVFLGQIRAINGDDWLSAFGGVWLLVFMAPTMMVGAGVSFFVMQLVKVLALVAVCFAPVSFAARVWPPLKTMTHQVLRVVGALLLVKPLLGLLMRVGNNLSASALVDNLGVGERVGQQVAASMVFVIMAVVPFLAFKLVPLAEHALVGQGVGSAPVRVANQLASSRHQLGRPGGGRPGGGAGSSPGRPVMQKGSVAAARGEPERGSPRHAGLGAAHSTPKGAGRRTASTTPAGGAGEVPADRLARRAAAMLRGSSAHDGGGADRPARTRSPAPPQPRSQGPQPASPLGPSPGGAPKPGRAGAGRGSVVAGPGSPGGARPAPAGPPVTRDGRALWDAPR